MRPALPARRRSTGANPATRDISIATTTASGVSSRGSAWASLRAQPWWIQALVWVFALPVAAVVWASARRSLRRTSLCVAAVLAVCCVSIPFGLTGADGSESVELRSADGGRTDAATRSSTAAPATAAPATAAPTTAPPATASPTTAPPASASPTTAPPTNAAPATGAPSARTTAESLLPQLSVADEVEHPGYDRDLFDHWIDADGNGCNTRCEVLLRQQLPGGGWFSTYDRTHVANSGDLDVDHVVALSEAWRSGAWAWDAARRREFANDLDEPRSLIAVSASSNRSKSDRDPASWRPVAEDDWCEYAISWMTVKTRWGLGVDPEEFVALQHLTERC